MLTEIFFHILHLQKEKKDDEYEKICFMCHRPESVTGKMIELPNNITVCSDCMQKSFDAMNSSFVGGTADYVTSFEPAAIMVDKIAPFSSSQVKLVPSHSLTREEE